MASVLAMPDLISPSSPGVEEAAEAGLSEDACDTCMWRSQGAGLPGEEPEEGFEALV